VNPTARPVLPSAAVPWLLGPAEIAVIRADEALLDRLAPGERPDPHHPYPIAALLATWLHEVEIGGAR
jgi:hypothetical protein